MRRFLRRSSKQRGAGLAEYSVVLCCVVLVATMGVANFSLTFREEVLCYGVLDPMVRNLDQDVIWSISWESSLRECWGVRQDAGTGVSTDIRFV